MIFASFFMTTKHKKIITIAVVTEGFCLLLQEKLRPWLNF